MDNSLVSHVFCYAGFSYPERPLAFEWQGQRFEVAQVVTTWQTPSGKTFYVRTSGEDLFSLEYDQGEERWLVQPLSLRVSA